MVDVKGPVKGETWKIGQYGPIVFIGMAWDLVHNKHFIFTEENGGLFTIEKDFFYHDISILTFLNEKGEWEKAER